MAEELAVAGVEGLVKRLLAFGIDEISLIRGATKEVEKLQTLLTEIQHVLRDAEMKQVTDLRVRNWLKKLKEAALDAEDVLEEFAYDCLRRKVVGDQLVSERERKVRNFLSFFTSLPLLRTTGHSIRDIRKRLKKIEEEKNDFQLAPTTAEIAAAALSSIANTCNVTRTRETSSIVEDSEVIGREADKEKIVDKLLIDNVLSGSNTNTNTTLSIIAIVGLGGLGKTTLAKLVYNDSRVVQQFGSMRIWICLSEDFAIKTVWLKILRQLNSSSYLVSESSSMQELQNHLEKELNGNKFMLVLDDVWQKDLESNDKWKDLILPLKRYGGTGSKVIVTTREDSVASTIGAHEKYNLQPLSDDQCWNLFESQAFVQGGPDRTPDLVKIGKQIVNKCGGVPLALKVLGRLMQSKATEREWSAILDREIWEADKDVQKHVMEMLKLSFNNLPPEVRQCFLYCSIFPKDYVIEKREVIQLWMAQGFLQTSSEGELMEDLGQKCMRILCTRSFFEENADLLTFKMHDLVHDLAMMLCGSECNGAGHANHVEPNEDLRHISLLPSHISWFPSRGAIEIPRYIVEAKKLRTFYIFREYNCPLNGTDTLKLLQLRLLRVLDLSQTCLRELPSSIGRLMHLKYLNLSHSKIKKLPSSIVKLYYLQSFNISECYELSELPESVASLTQLRHFNLYRTSNNHETPRGLSKLHFLQTLDILKLCARNASEQITELEHLNYLGGTLRLQNLGYVNDVEAVKKANFMEKKNLHTLDMNWECGIQGDNVSHYAELLEALRPHSNLKELKIRHFQGLNLPGWMTNDFALSNLVKLQFRYCHKCKEMKSLGELPSLKELEIKRMDNLSRIGEDSHNHQVAESSTTTRTKVKGLEAATILYPSLEQLSVRDVPNLEEWFENSAEIFPKLQELMLCGCPTLKNMPSHFPSLQKLTIEKVNNTDIVRSITKNVTSLTSLSFVASSSSSSSSSEKEEEEVARMLGKNKLLESLTVNGLSSMRSMPHLSPSLKKLNIGNCPVLQIESARLPCVVESLWIYDVKAFVVDDTLWSNKLSSLHIYNVFVQLPVDFLRNNMLLRTISIQSCPQFEGFLSSPDSPPPPSSSSSSSSSCCVESLGFIDCPSILRLQLQGFTKFRYLYVVGCKGLQSLEGLQTLRNIEWLKIGPFSEELNDFPILDGIEMGDHLISSLRYLHIYGWSRLKSLPEQIQHLSRLENLFIDGFDGMENLPDWLGKLTSLETLTICNCKNLMHLPSANAMRKLTSLRTLEIWKCPLLKERCKPPKKRCGLCSGSEWHKISHISEVEFHPMWSDEENEEKSSSLSRLVKKKRSNVC
ncbi:hypothetical protein Sjap_008687 [Stephania japonica]|uniref:Uncharacterized protein n=1 Tax=Stephania japonica TaxID=461633 RepID=A0AAP0JRL3_9MAGN